MPQDEKYYVAVEVARKAGYASVSQLQRELNIGYFRAARLLEALQSNQVVGERGSYDHARPRLCKFVHEN